jgi:hypothetical protein
LFDAKIRITDLLMTGWGTARRECRQTPAQGRAPRQKRKVTHRATWIIRDNGRDVSTGRAADEIEAAEAKRPAGGVRRK